MPSPRRHRGASGTVWAICIASAVFFTAFAVITFATRLDPVMNSFEAGLAGHGNGTGDPTLAAIDEDIELQTSCSGDVLLATAGRAAMCLAGIEVQRSRGALEI